MRTTILIFLASTISYLSAFGQPSLDSLFMHWQNEELSDSLRTVSYKDYIWKGFLQSDPDSARTLAKEMIRFAERSGYKKALATAYNTQGASYYVQGDYPRAVDYFLDALRIMEEMDDEQGVASAVSNIGILYKDMEEYELALEYQHRGLSLREDLGDRQGVAISLNNIGVIHHRLSDYEKAVDFQRRSLAIKEELGNRRGIASSLNNLGNTYMSIGDYPKALKRFLESLSLNEDLGREQAISNNLINIGLIHHLRGEQSTAIEYCQEGYDKALALNILKRQKEGCECLYLSHKALGTNKEALEFLELTLAAQDSLHAQETAKKLQRMEFDKELLADSLRQEEEKHAIEMAHQAEVAQKDKTRNLLMGGGLLLFLLAAGLYSRNRHVNRPRQAIQKEKDRSEELLLNILPEEVADELKEKGEAEAQLIDQVTVLFTDFKGFTAMSEQLSPKDLVKDLNDCFSEFDRITAKYSIEKIKTIGDAYMAAGGLPTPKTTHANDVIHAALEMRDFVEAGKAKKIEAGLPYFEIRVGVHTGPVVAGIVGVKKFQYDIWGDTVNTASRMKSSGAVGKVNISEATYELVNSNSEFDFTPRGKIEAKEKGDMEMFYVSHVL